MINSYTPWQVLDALERQGYSKLQAAAMFEAMGGERKNSRQVRSGYRAVGAEDAETPSGKDGQQDSTLAPNLAEGISGTLAAGYLGHKLPKLTQGARFGQNALRAAGRFTGTGLAANLATMGTMALTDNNSYDRMSTPQIVADMGGSLGGALVGEGLGRAAGTRLARGATASGIKKVVESAAAKAGETGLKGAIGRGAVTALAGRGAAAAAGRAGGAALGTVLGPLGSIALGTLGGWLLPKLFTSGSEAVEDDPIANRDKIANMPRRRKKKEWETPLGGDTTDQMYGEQP